MKNIPALRNIPAVTCFGLASLSALVSCGSNAAGIVVTVQDIADTTVRLEVKPTVGGKALSTEVFSDIAGSQQLQLGFRLPSAYVGQPVTFQVDGINSKGCREQTANLEINTDAIRRYDTKVSLMKVTPNSITANLFAVHGTASNDVWAVGSAGTVAHYDGCNWQPQAPFTSVALTGVYAAPGTAGAASTAVYAIGVREIYKWDGNTWATEAIPALPAGATLTAIHGIAATDVWAAALYNGNPSCIILHRSALGWAQDASCTSTIGTYRLKSLHAINASTVIVGGSDGAGPKVGEWNTGTWRAADALSPPQTSDVTCVWGTAQNDYWAGGDLGAMQHYSQRNWQVDNSYQSFFPSGTGTVRYLVSRMAGVAADDFWALAIATTPTYTSRVAHYTGSWKLESQLNTHTQLTAVWAAAKNDVWFVGYNGLRLHYDGGSFTAAK